MLKSAVSNRIDKLDNKISRFFYNKNIKVIFLKNKLHTKSNNVISVEMLSRTECLAKRGCITGIGYEIFLSRWLGG